jgi:hypothetical protein
MKKAKFKKQSERHAKAAVDGGFFVVVRTETDRARSSAK